MSGASFCPTLCLVRHGALAPNPERRFVGASDVPLSARGRQQMATLARELSDLLCHPGLAAILSSGLKRSQESAFILKEHARHLGRHDLPLLHDAAFNEIHLGQWEGLTPQEVQANFPGQYEYRWQHFAHFCPEGGESFARVQQRVLSALSHWQNRFLGKSLLLVAHAGVNRCILADCLALPLTAFANLGQFLALPQAYASYCCLKTYPERVP